MDPRLVWALYWLAWGFGRFMVMVIAVALVCFTVGGGNNTAVIFNIAITLWAITEGVYAAAFADEPGPRMISVGLMALLGSVLFG
jgi:hypothetical protein